MDKKKIIVYHGHINQIIHAILGVSLGLIVGELKGALIVLSILTLSTISSIMVCNEMDKVHKPTER